MCDHEGALLNPKIRQAVLATGDTFVVEGRHALNGRLRVSIAMNW